MNNIGTSCFRFGDGYKCPVCQSYDLVKNGKTSNEKQRYQCKHCHKRFITNYTYKAYQPDTNQKIIQLTKEGLGIRGTARVLAISVTTLLKRILLIASKIKQAPIATGRTYEVDEMRIFIGNKSRLRWLVYALDRETRQVVAFNVGRRTNRTLSVVLKSLFLSNAKIIYTDKLKNYGYLISRKIHRTVFRSTNHIERHNLTLRTHLKRLNRKTICYSRSFAVLMATIMIYLWH
ncbi:MAG: IS1 transposase [Bacteroidetes bacterium ADurb.BinA174]|nr:MAG: IS1 transposase [Bacteroidetes bacterium ADurb.BinA174]